MTINTITRCIDCGGKILYGEPLHKSTVHDSGKTYIEYRCEICAEDYARALWPEEEWGPYPHPPHPPGGRA